MNESKFVAGENEGSNSPIMKMNLLRVSQSSSLLSNSKTGNVFNLRSICSQSNRRKTNEKEESS